MYPSFDQRLPRATPQRVGGWRVRCELSCPTFLFGLSLTTLNKSTCYFHFCSLCHFCSLAQGYCKTFCNVPNRLQKWITLSRVSVVLRLCRERDPITSSRVREFSWWMLFIQRVDRWPKKAAQSHWSRRLTIPWLKETFPPFLLCWTWTRQHAAILWTWGKTTLGSSILGGDQEGARALDDMPDRTVAGLTNFVPSEMFTTNFLRTLSQFQLKFFLLAMKSIPLQKDKLNNNTRKHNLRADILHINEYNYTILIYEIRY